MTQNRKAMVAMAATAALLLGCGGGGGDGDTFGGSSPPDAVRFRVRSAAGARISGATVYLVPAEAVNGTAFSGADILNGQAADRDEPLEDAVRLGGGSFPRGVTGATGEVVVSGVPFGRYFWYVEPGPGDEEHLPGGSGSRDSRDTSTFLGTVVNVVLSSQPSPAATHVGTSTCMVCHTDFDEHAGHAHRLGLVRPGFFGPLQDPERYPGIDDGWARFLPAASFMGGTPVYATDFDPTRSTDKFRTTLSNPPGSTLFLIAWLWRDNADGRFKITLQNMVNPGDPSSPRTLVVDLTYGGALSSQVYLVRITGLRGLYPILQFQLEGDEGRFERTRKVYRDYRLDSFFDPVTQTLRNPGPTQTFEASCAGCHYNGYQLFQDGMTGEWLSDAVDDQAGIYDADRNGTPDEVNIGCESCHGAGSEHVAWASSAANRGRERRFIVSPRNLSPEREMLICGRCHDRPVANHPVMSEMPLDQAGRMPSPGISRAEYLAVHTTRAGPALDDYWSDGFHSRSNYQQYSDMVKSAMHRNGRILTTCQDCHEPHGEGAFEHQLTSAVADPNSNLCQSCHAVDISSHMIEKTGSTHAGNSTTCVRCHMPQTAQSGAGRYGLLLGLPTGTMGDDAITYFENDTTSHHFLGVPRKTHPDVAGVVPAAAMPIPYTNSCGAPCHQAGPLPTLTPVPFVPDPLDQLSPQAVGTWQTAVSPTPNKER